MSESIVISSELAKRIYDLYKTFSDGEIKVEYPTWTEIITKVLDYYARNK